MRTALTSSDFNRIRAGYEPIVEDSWSLPAEVYCDPQFLAIESEHIFGRSWHFLCHAEKLREAGRYLTGIIRGVGVFAVRDTNGTLRAFYNVCKHRGHELLRGEGLTRAILCPYHAWSYHTDGSLRAAPGSQTLGHFDKNCFTLKSVRIEVFCGLVFVNLDDGAPPLSVVSGGLANEIQSYAPDLERLTFAHRLSYSIAANWKSVVDNFLECRHCPIAHKDFCTLVDMSTYEVKNQGQYISHIAKAGNLTNSAYGVAGATVTDHAVWFLWPNTALMRYPGRGNFMVWQFIPTGPETTREEFHFFFESSTPTSAEEQAIEYIDRVLQREDIDLVESVQRGMGSGAFERGRYLIDPNNSGLSEHGVHHFHGLILDAYSHAAQP